MPDIKISQTIAFCESHTAVLQQLGLQAAEAVPQNHVELLVLP